MVYARDTNVSVIRTRNEIERTLERYGADGFAYATQSNMATVIFVMENRRIRFVLELPDPEEFATRTTASRGSGQSGSSGSPMSRPADRSVGRRCW